MMSRLLYAKPNEHFICLCILYNHFIFVFFFPSFVPAIGVAFAFTFYVCLCTVICSFILFCS